MFGDKFRFILVAFFSVLILSFNAYGQNQFYDEPEFEEVIEGDEYLPDKNDEYVTEKGMLEPVEADVADNPTPEALDKEAVKQKLLQDKIKAYRDRISQSKTGRKQPLPKTAKKIVPPAPVKRLAKPKVIPQRQVEAGAVLDVATEMAIGDLIQIISELTDETFLLDESVKGKRITIIAPGGKVRVKNAMRLFEAILDLNGFSMVRKGAVNKIMLKRDIKTESIPIELGKELTDPSDRFVTRIIQLTNLNSGEVANTLRPFISKDGDIVAYPSSNTLIIVETKANLNRILEIIKNIDLEITVEFVKIQHVEAAEIAEKITEIFSGGTSATVSTSSQQQRGSTTRRQTTGRTATPRRSAGTAPGGTAGQQSYLGFKIIVDERSNTLIIAAYKEDLEKIKSIIRKLDTKVEQPEQGIYVIRLQNADADHMVEVLSNLISGSGTTRSAQTRRTDRTSSGRRSGALGGTTGGLSTLGSSNALGGGSFIDRQVGQGGGISALVAQTEGLRITSDSTTNSIILISSRRDYEIIKSVIDELDVRRKQVFVEAAILEVSLDKVRSVGANLSLGFTFNDNNLGFGGTILPGVPSLLGVAASETAIVSTLGSLSGLFLGVIGESVDPDGSGPIPPIPSFSALFQAIAGVTDVNILSTPSLLTLDNEEAEIVVADVIPFPTGSTIGESGVTIQSIDRQPVGIRLVITPHISEGDYLKLDIHTEVSEVRDAAIPGLNTEEFGIATTTRTSDSSVVVKDGQTIVIGGLIQDRVSSLISKVPLLGDIPFLGNLFKFKQTSSRKINLMILITPRIISNEHDMQLILEERQRKNMLLQQNGY